MGLGEVSFDPAMRSFGQFMLGDGSEEAGGRPSFTIGLLGKLLPERLDRGQPQFVEHDAKPGFVDCVDALHATSSRVGCPDQGFVAIERCELHVNGRQLVWIRAEERSQGR